MKKTDKMTNKMTNINIKFPLPLLDYLKQQAAAQYTNVSQYIRDLVVADKNKHQ
jgi:predicted DNA binding CopG/RHH family protein